MENVVGYRFVPTDEELINHYLKNKNLGKSWLVDDGINEVDIYRYDPWDLPQFSKIKSKDPVSEWYFFSRKEYTSVTKKLRKRKTPSGFWKITAKDQILTEDKRENGGPIGIRRRLSFHLGKSGSDESGTDWGMHEYHITYLPEHQRDYDEIIPSSNSLVSILNNVKRISNSTPSEVEQEEQAGQEIFDGLHLEDLEIPINEQQIDHSLWEQYALNMFDDLPNVQQVPCIPPDDREFLEGLQFYNPMEFEFLFEEDHSIFRSMHGSHNDYMPKESLSGFIANYSYHNDAESIYAMSYQEKSSLCDSVGSSNDPSVDKQSAMVKTENKDWFVMEKKRRKPPYIYLMNVIISFIVLVGLIGDIISVLLTKV